MIQRSRSTNMTTNKKFYLLALLCILLLENICIFWGFPGSSAGKEFTCNAGDPSSTPGSGRPPGEGIGYPLQYT